MITSYKTRRSVPLRRYLRSLLSPGLALHCGTGRARSGSSEHARAGAVSGFGHPVTDALFPFCALCQRTDVQPRIDSSAHPVYRDLNEFGANPHTRLRGGLRSGRTARRQESKQSGH